jgi:hypothetical protein
MKLHFPIWFLLGLVGLMPLRVWANCVESNNDPNCVKKVIMRSTIVCGSYYSSSFTCEHYLGNGESMAFYDYQSGSDCWYTYTADSITFIPGGISSLGVTTATGWEFAPTLYHNSSNVLLNFGADTLTIRGKDGNGGLLGSGLAWSITDLVNGVVTQDWTTQDSISLGNLSAGPAFRIQVRFMGSTSTFETVFDFATGTVAYGAGGKIRSSPDNSYPYQQERQASCVLVCLRHVLYLKGKSVPTEDALVAIMVANGKSESDFLTGKGILHSEMTSKLNLVLNPYGLTAVAATTALTEPDVLDKLNAGKVIIVGHVLDTKDKYAAVNFDPNHALVMRKVGAKIEIIDSSTGKAKLEDPVKALSYLVWGGSPPVTGLVWEITP